MSVVVVNRLRFSVPVDELSPRIADAFPPAFDECAGFEGFELVKVGDHEVVVLIHWADGASAQAGAARIGPTIFNDLIVPNLAAEQDRVVGPVVVQHPAAARQGVAGTRP
jgi:hypothetical protein